MTLAETMQLASDQGISVEGWIVIIGAVTAALAQLFTLLGWTKAAKATDNARRLGQAGIEAIEEFNDEHPELKKKLQVYAKDKATKLGIDLHFEEEVDKITTRMKREKEANGGA